MSFSSFVYVYIYAHTNICIYELFRLGNIEEGSFQEKTDFQCFSSYQLPVALHVRVGH